MAHRVAAVSKAVADETMRGFGVPASRIEVIPNGVDEFWSPGTRGESDYLLYAGTLEPRKGVHDLIAAWSSLPEPRPRLIDRYLIAVQRGGHRRHGHPGEDREPGARRGLHGQLPTQLLEPLGHPAEPVGESVRGDDTKRTRRFRRSVISSGFDVPTRPRRG